MIAKKNHFVVKGMSFIDEGISTVTTCGRAA